MSNNNPSAVIEESQQLFNRGDLDAYIHTLYAPDCVFHYFPPGMPHGHQGAHIFYNAFNTGFPDAQLHIDDLIAEGEETAVRYHLDMTHTGEFNGIPATGKRASLHGVTIMRWQNGKVVERWSENDFMGLMQQLGVIPA